MLFKFGRLIARTIIRTKDDAVARESLREPKKSSHMVWIVIAVIVVAILAYFLLFTRTPDEGTRTERPLAPATSSDQPAPESETPGSTGGASQPANP